MAASTASARTQQAPDIVQKGSKRGGGFWGRFNAQATVRNTAHLQLTKQLVDVVSLRGQADRLL